MAFYKFPRSERRRKTGGDPPTKAPKSRWIRVLRFFYRLFSFNQSPALAEVSSEEASELHRLCRALVLKVASSGDARRQMYGEVKHSVAQYMVDFLAKVLDEPPPGGISQPERKRILHLLSKLVKSAQVFPQRLKLKGVECDMNRPVTEGGFGYIYKTVYKDRPICVKAVRLHGRGNINEKLRSHAGEIILWAHLSHLNILPFYGIFLSTEEAPRMCIVSPWMENGDLLQFLEIYPDTPRLPLLHDIISGLQYLHEFDVVHADLKAQNVLVSGTNRAMLADFGISRVSLTKPTVTENTTAGTGKWMAPELLVKDNPTPTRESDIWAFGCVCYEAITGKPPFHHIKHSVQLVAAFMKGGAIPLKPDSSSTWGDSSKSIWSLARLCWNYDPAARPSSDSLKATIASLTPPHDCSPEPATQLVKETPSAIDYAQVHAVLENIRQTHNISDDIEDTYDLSRSPTPDIPDPDADDTPPASVVGKGPWNWGKMLPALPNKHRRAHTLGPLPTQNGSQNSDVDGSVMDLEESMALSQCRELLLKVMANTKARVLFTSLSDNDAQSMVDFLAKLVLENPAAIPHDRKRILHLIPKLAKAAAVFPKRFQLEAIAFDAARPVAESGFAYVYKAEHDGEEVCIKAVRLFRHAEDRKALIAHAGEIMLWAHSSHPNVLPCHGIFLSNESIPRACMVSPWIGHGNLIQYLSEFPHAPHIPLLHDVIRGIKYLHDLDIVHANLKARNILVSERHRAMLADFGASRMSTTASGVAATSVTNIAAGTANWMAPELFLEDTPVPKRESDIWAFGCVCYEVLTGMAPFHHIKTIPQLINAFFRHSASPQKPENGLSESGESVWSLIEPCWQYEARKRPTAGVLQSSFANLDETDDRLPEPQLHIMRISDIRPDYDNVLRTLQRIKETCDKRGSEDS